MLSIACVTLLCYHLVVVLSPCCCVVTLFTLLLFIEQPYVLCDLLVVCGKLGHKQALVTMKQAMKSHMRKNLYKSAVTDFKVCVCVRREMRCVGGFFINPLFRKVGAVLPGFVRNMQPYGCFVDFPHQLTGLAHLKHLSDQFVSRPSEVYQETQTVWAKVHERNGLL